VVFVPYTAPGDEAKVRITDRQKNYSQGVCEQIITPSPLRETPPCPHFTQCGGCSWQHLPYSLQFETKKKGMIHALSRGGVSIESIPVDDLPAKTHYGYRNRIQLHGDKAKAALGFYRPGTKEIIDLAKCEIADPRINEKLAHFRAEGMGQFKGEFKLELDVSPEGQVRAAWNRRNAAFGFRQINDEQNQSLQHWVSSHVADADVLFDLFGGDGNLSLGLASRFKRVECVDLFTPRESHASLPSHFHFDRKDMEKWTRSPLSADLIGKTTSVILDPPREGMNRLVDGICKKLESQSIQSLILVGCDVDAFVRDTRNLVRRGLRLQRIGVLDLFPQTPHVESLALFSR
jgi:23S rRNA (uracil1939-C5)-methyltransferase